MGETREPGINKSKSHVVPLKRYSHNLKKLSRNSSSVMKLTKRSEFLALNSKYTMPARGLYLQGNFRLTEDPSSLNLIRVGFTCSKKVGNSVVRNKSKRRLRHLARQYLSRIGNPGWDYVLIGRKDETAKMPFSELKKSFESAMIKLHRNLEKKTK